MCYVILVWWFAEGSFAALGPVTNTSGTDEEINFFLSTQAVCVYTRWKWWISLGFGFLIWKAGCSAVAPFLLEDLFQSLGQKLGWQHCIQTKQGAQRVSEQMRAHVVEIIWY